MLPAWRTGLACNANFALDACAGPGLHPQQGVSCGPDMRSAPLPALSSLHSCFTFGVQVRGVSHEAVQEKERPKSMLAAK